MKSSGEPAPTVGAMFAGYGGLELAVADVFPDARLAWVAEIEPAPARILAHHWPDVPNLGDVTAVDWAAVEPVDIITGGSPCFPAGTLIDTTDGYRPIETIRLGDLVRTHRERYMPVVQLMPLPGRHRASRACRGESRAGGAGTQPKRWASPVATVRRVADDAARRVGDRRAWRVPPGAAPGARERRRSGAGRRGLARVPRRRGVTMTAHDIARAHEAFASPTIEAG